MTSNDKNNPNKVRSLIVKGTGTDVSTAGKGARLISRMNEDALAAIDSTRRDLTPVMRRLGKYELHEEDYQQLHNWALNFDGQNGDPNSALELADELAKGNQTTNALTHLVGYRIPWLESGRIKNLKSDLYWERLDLSKVPALEVIDVSLSNTSELNLSKVPQLKRLRFDGGKLQNLDLSSSIKLEFLSLEEVELAKPLKLSNLSKLKKVRLRLVNSELLEISNNPNLDAIHCEAILSSKVKIAKLPKLNTLFIDHHSDVCLNEIGLSDVPELEYFNCNYNF